MKLKQRMFRWIVGLDQAFNPLLLGGSEDVTISAETAYRELIRHSAAARRGRKMLDWIFRAFFGQKFHCYDSLWAEIQEFPKKDRVAIRHALRTIPGVAEAIGIPD